MVASFNVLSFGAEKAIDDVPASFDSFRELEAWAEDCPGGGWATKFQTRWKNTDVEVCYTNRCFNSGIATSEIVFWGPRSNQKWKRIVGTSVLRAELKVTTSLAGCSIEAYDSTLQSWIT